MTTLLMLMSSLLFIALIGLVVFKGLKMLNNRLNIRWTPKHIVVVVTGYIALGLLAFVYLSFFYDPELTALSNEDIHKLEQVTTDLQKYDIEGDSIYLTDAYKKETWQYEFEGDALPVAINKGDNGHLLNSDVRLRYNDDIEQGQVVISYYQFPVIIEGIDLADEMPLPNISVSEQQLTIAPAPSHSIHYNLVNASLSILDFNRENFDESGTVSYQYSSVLLIEVARSTNVEDLQGLINIIN